MDEERLSEIEHHYVMVCMLQREMVKSFKHIAEFFDSVNALAGSESSENVFADIATQAGESTQAFLELIPTAFAHPQRVIDFIENHNVAIMWQLSEEGNENVRE